MQGICMSPSTPGRHVSIQIDRGICATAKAHTIGAIGVSTYLGPICKVIYQIMQQGGNRITLELRLRRKKPREAIMQETVAPLAHL